MLPSDSRTKKSPAIHGMAMNGSSSMRTSASSTARPQVLSESAARADAACASRVADRLMHDNLVSKASHRWSERNGCLEHERVRVGYCCPSCKQELFDRGRDTYTPVGIPRWGQPVCSAEPRTVAALV